MGSTFTRIAVALAVAVVVAVIAAIAGLWNGIGDSEISAGGWLASHGR